jgi:2-polyprenyl-3-methyl-5-hydroxy-6-metoxy-1,4-benzoquinol methylase
MQCNICLKNNSKELNLKEMLYGTRESFLYYECQSCGHIQIGTIPKDLGSHYDGDYYSKKEDVTQWYNNPIKNIFKHIRENSKFNFSQDPIMYLGVSKYPILKMLKEKKITKNSKILDVGCGSGELLFYLNNFGFKNLTGVDPFIDKNIEFGNVKILKANVEDLNQKYDLILSSHQFEHVTDPFKELKNFKELVDDKGYIIIRTPVADNDIYYKYGKDWIGLDAPRHINIFTRESLNTIFTKSKLIVKDVINDSLIDGLYITEQYSKDHSMQDIIDNPSLKPNKNMKNYDLYFNQVNLMNKENKADQLSIILQKN